MKLTLNIIKEYHPCKSGWGILLKSLNKTKADDIELDLMTVLKSNGIEDAVWCLRCFDYLDVCLFLADVADSVLPIYEANNKSKAPRKAIQAIRDFKSGKITKDELNELRFAAYTAYTAAYAAASAAYPAAYTAASAAAYAAAAYAAAASAASDAAASAASDAAGRLKWEEIEVLFIKHFS